MADGGYRLVAWPGARNAVVDLLEAAHRKHNITAAWEIDFTEAHARMRRIRRQTGVAVSLNAYLVYALGRTVLRHPMAQAVRWKKNLVFYDGVDVGTAIDFTQAGTAAARLSARGSRLPTSDRLPRSAWRCAASRNRIRWSVHSCSGGRASAGIPAGFVRSSGAGSRCESGAPPPLPQDSRPDEPQFSSPTGGTVLVIHWVPAHAVANVHAVRRLAL